MLTMMLEIFFYIVPMLGMLYLSRWLWNRLVHHIEALPPTHHLHG
ncbi:hypothetical protein [Magnetococcus sp. PR-3]